jgi:hypothetical protein
VTLDGAESVGAKKKRIDRAESRSQDLSCVKAT